MATVDIIIPAFNAARFLPFSLQSVVSQTFDDWRILLVDDGSTDNTTEAVAPFWIASVPKSDTSSKRIVVCQRQETLPSGLNSRIPRSARCRRCVVALPTLRVVEDIGRAAAGWSRLWPDHSIDQENRPGITWLGNLSDADGHIARRFTCERLICPAHNYLPQKMRG